MSQKIQCEKKLSIVITAHREGYLLRPSLNSIFLSAMEVSSGQTNCEIIVVLDDSDELTQQQALWFEQLHSQDISIKIIKTNSKDPGISRNVGVENSEGKYIALCDGDDLVSPNYFSAGLKILEAQSLPLILHSEYVLSFGARSILSPLRDSQSDSVDYRDIIYSNLWPSASISQATTYKENPYSRFNAKSGFGPEDWVWNIETCSKGIPRATIPNSVYCYRTKKASGVNNSHQSSILPKIDINKLKEQFPPSEKSTHEAGKSYWHLRELLKRAGKVVYAFSTALPYSIGSKILKIAGNIYRRIFNIHLVTYRLTPELIIQLKQIANLEPAISIAASQWEILPIWDPVNTKYTQILENVLNQLDGHHKALIWVPWLGIGGADMVALNYTKALRNSPKYSGEISIIATYKPERTILDLIPENVNFIQLPTEFRDLSEQEQQRLIAQIFIQTQPELALSINCFDVTNALKFFSGQMSQKTKIYLSLFAFDHISHGFPVNPITDDAERIYLNDVTGIITDNTTTKKRLDEMLGLLPDFTEVHKQPVFEITPNLEKNSAAYAEELDNTHNPAKLLWPHRLDKEKNPRTLIEISKLAKNRGIPVEITIFGQQVLGYDQNLLVDLKQAGIKYCGPYQGGLSQLPYDNFHGMLLTSESEGMPLAVIQSMLLGLPVIATNVGGIPDLIINDETGYLVQSPDDIDGFIQAIIKIRSLKLRRPLIEKAYSSAVSGYSWETFCSNHLFQ